MKRLFLRFVQVFALAFGILTSVYVLRGQAPETAVVDAAMWASISALIAASTVASWVARGKRCAVCESVAERR